MNPMTFRALPLAKLLFLIFALTSFNSIELVAQPPIEWEFTAGGAEGEGGRKLLPTEGGIIVIGTSSSTDFDLLENQGGLDAVIFKVDDDGNTIWQKSYGGSGSDVIYDIQETSDQGFIAVGASSSEDGDVGANNGETDFWIFKLDSAGNLQWTKNYGGSSEDNACSVAITQDEGFVVVGDSRSDDGDVSGNYGQFDAWVIRLDSAGDLVWDNHFGGSAADKTTSIVQLADEGYLLVSGTESNDFDVSENYSVVDDDDDGEDIWVVRLDAEGELVWEQNYGGSGEDSPEGLLQIDEQNFVICGRTSSGNFDVNDPNGSNDGWVFQINDQAEIAWSNSLGGTDWDRVNAITFAADGGYLFAGNSYSTDGEASENYGEQDVWIGKLSVDGELMWENNYGGTGFENARSIVQFQDGHILFAGNTTSSDVDVSANNGSDDFWVVCLESTIPQSIGEVNEGAVFRTFPNPAQNQFTISVSDLTNPIQCTIHNAIGQLERSFTLTSPTTVVDISGLALGVYTVTLGSKANSSVQMVIVE